MSKTKKKYELIENDTVTSDTGAVLRRIRALRDIAKFGVKKGDLGGYVESENNLSHSGYAWVSDNARVYGDAQVFGDGIVYDYAIVYGKACVYAAARVSGYARVYDHARVYGDAQVLGYAWVSGNARVYDHARVYSDAQVYGNARVHGDARISDNARVSNEGLIFWASIVGSANGTLTVYKSENDTLLVTRGCFKGTAEEFLQAVNAKHDERIRREYALLIEVAKSRIEHAKAVTKEIEK